MKDISDLRIAFLLPSVISRGPVIFTDYLLQGLKKYVEDIEVFYFKGKVEYNLGVKCTKISRYKRYDFSEFDIIHSTMGVPDIYASIYCKNIPWVTSMHNYIDKDTKMARTKIRASLILFLWKRALAKADNIIVSSRQMEEYYRCILGEKNYCVIPYGIAEQESGEIEKRDRDIIAKLKEDGYMIIGSVGLLVKRKGFHQILELLKIKKNCAAIIIGDGPEYHNLKDFAKKSGIEDRFYLLGYKENSFNYYNDFVIYAHVSYSEGFGLALLEAMSKSKPIICSNLDIYQDFFSKDDVVYYELDNINSLSQAYDRIVKNMNHYSTMSYKIFKDIFSLDTMTIGHIKYYMSVIEGYTQSNIR